MIYVHHKSIKKSPSTSSVVKIIFGAICLLLFLAHIRSIITDTNDSTSIFFAIQFLLGAVLLLFFGIRSAVRTSKSYEKKDPAKIAVDKSNPFYFAQCNLCATKYDYQESDLRYSNRYPNGYFACPCCNKAIRHIAKIAETEYNPWQDEETDELGNVIFAVNCSACSSMFQYTICDLGFRPWYPNGYAVCPYCSSPVRHNSANILYKTTHETPSEDVNPETYDTVPVQILEKRSDKEPDNPVIIVSSSITCSACGANVEFDTSSESQFIICPFCFTNINR